MNIKVEKREVLKVAIYLSIFFLAIFLGSKVPWPAENVESKQPIEVKSPRYSDSSLYDYYQIQEHIDEYIDALEERIAELEGRSPLERKTIEDFLR